MKVTRFDKNCPTKNCPTKKYKPGHILHIPVNLSVSLQVFRDKTPYLIHIIA